MLLSGILVGAFAYSGLTAYGAVIGITADIVDTADGFVIKPGGDGTSATPYVYFHNSDSTFTITDDISIAAIAAGGYITNGNFAELSAPTATEMLILKLWLKVALQPRMSMRAQWH